MAAIERRDEFPNLGRRFGRVHRIVAEGHSIIYEISADHREIVVLRVFSPGQQLPFG